MLHKQSCSNGACAAHLPAMRHSRALSGSAAGVLLLPVACALDPHTHSVLFLGALPLDLEYKWQG